MVSHQKGAIELERSVASIQVGNRHRTNLSQLDLLAEQDDNVLHKPLTPLEAAALYRELKELLAQDAARRQQSTRFSSEHQPGSDGAAHLPAPLAGPLGITRERAAAMVPGSFSYTTFDKIGYLEKITTDTAQPAELRERAKAELERLASEALARVRAEEREKRKRKRRARPVRPVHAGQFPTRAFVLIWEDTTD